MFAIAFHIHCDVTQVEAMSHRQIVGWVEALGLLQTGRSDPDAIEYKSLSKADLKAAFR